MGGWTHTRTVKFGVSGPIVQDLVYAPAGRCDVNMLIIKPRLF